MMRDREGEAGRLSRGIASDNGQLATNDLENDLWHIHLITTTPAEQSSTESSMEVGGEGKEGGERGGNTDQATFTGCRQKAKAMLMTIVNVLLCLTEAVTEALCVCVRECVWMYVSVIVSVPVCAHMFMRHCVYDTIADINDACHHSVQRRGEGKAWLQGGKTETEAVEEGRTRKGGESRGP